MNIFTTVTRVRFAHDDKSRLACSSSDNQLSICQVIPEPATVIAVLQGHTGDVTGIWLNKPLFFLKNGTLEMSKNWNSNIWSSCLKFNKSSTKYLIRQVGFSA